VVHFALGLLAVYAGVRVNARMIRARWRQADSFEHAPGRGASKGVLEGAGLLLVGFLVGRRRNQRAAGGAYQGWFNEDTAE
jgi:hypothetical protein